MSTAATSPGSNGDSHRSTRQFATFWLNDKLYGIPILQVQEILLRQHVTPVPLAPPYVLGLIGLRGQIVTALDLKRRVGIAEQQPVNEPNHLVVSASGSTASLQVDRVGDVLELPNAQMQPPPESLQGIDPAFLEGVFMLDERILAILNVPKLLDVA